MSVQYLRCIFVLIISQFLWIVFNFAQFAMTMAKGSIIWLYYRLAVTDGQRLATKWLLGVVLFQGLSATIVRFVSFYQALGVPC